jgi:hypothetical protein
MLELALRWLQFQVFALSSPSLMTSEQKPANRCFVTSTAYDATLRKKQETNSFCLKEFIDSIQIRLSYKLPVFHLADDSYNASRIVSEYRISMWVDERFSEEMPHSPKISACSHAHGTYLSV